MFIGIEEREVIYESDNVRVIRGRRTRDGIDVVVKSLHAGVSSKSVSARLRYEYDMLQQVMRTAIPQISAPLELLESAGQTGLVLEDIGGRSVTSTIGKKRLATADVLHIAEQVAHALKRVHDARLVHKDVNPNNIVWNRDNARVQLIDFGITTQLRREAQSSESLRSLDGTPAYISPEQTGRTGFLLDYRADFYSLGVTLYQLLANRMPFEESDVGELVYAILAVQPPSLKSLAPDAPACLVAVVEKLMDKSPDGRYQSAHGLLHDLAQCRRVIAERGPFVLGQADRVERFEIPQKLYGREADVDALRAAYAACYATKSTSLALISGPSGIGKSSLLQQLRPEILKNKGIYIAGKHDQLRRHMPFSAFARAISMWVQDVLKEPDDVRQAWERRMRGVLGNVGQALINIAPDLELLVGKQKPIPELQPRENENRLLTLLQRFLQTLAKQAPLVLFLDDLQWADSGTLKLLATLAEGALDCSGLLLVGAYRSNEVDAAHPLAMTLAEIDATDMAVHAFEVKALEIGDVTAMIVDATHAEADEVLGLAELVWRKTEGNPFFLHELLSHLWDMELIRYDGSTGKFSWSLDRIATSAVPDTAVGLMTQKMEALAPEQRDALSLGACLGDKFKLDLLAEIAGVPRAAMAGRLEPALRAGLLLPLDGAYRYASMTDDDVTYKFAHDRVQQAAYSLLPLEKAQQHHRALGHLLWPKIGTANGPDVFAVLEHVNKALPLLRDADEKREVSDLNLHAAREAKRAAAYAICLQYLRTAEELLPPDLATVDPMHFRRIGAEMAEAEHLSGASEAGLVRLEAVIATTPKGHEAAEMQTLRAGILDNMGRHLDALNACMAGLAAIDSPIKLKNPLHLIVPLVRVLLRSGSLESMDTAPECTDPHVLATMRLLSVASSPAFNSGNVPVFLAVVTNLSWLSLKYGRSSSTAFSFATLVVAFGNLGLRKIARVYAQAALRLVQHGNVDTPAGVHLCADLWSMWLDYGPAELLKVSEEGYIAGRDSGDLLYGGWQAATVVWIQQRLSLAAGDQVHAAYRSGLRSAAPHVFARAEEQSGRALRGLTESPLSLTSAEFSQADFDAYLAAHPGHDAGTVGIQFNRMMVHFIHQDYATAARLTVTLYRNNALQACSNYINQILAYYGSLAILQDAQKSGRYCEGGRAALKGLRSFARSIGVHSHVLRGDVLLVEAEVAAFAGKATRAAQLFERACGMQQESGWPDLFATGLERAGRFHARVGNRLTANLYLQRAHDAFNAWGAVVKAKMLREEFELAETALAQTHRKTTHETVRGSTRAGTHSTRSTATATTRGSGHVDFAAMMRVAQAISGETVLDNVIAKALAGLQQAAGATRTALVLGAGSDLVQAGDTAQAGTELPRQLLQLAARTKRKVVMQDLTKASENDDPYLRGTSAKALACVPLLSHGSLVGVLYIENALAAVAFAPERLEAVEFLASQVAIALANAQSRAQMEEEVAKRTQEVRDAHAQVLRLEKESTEVQMAGGFAHEMRNALSAARWPLAALYPLDDDKSGTPVHRSFGEVFYGLDTVLERVRAGAAHAEIDRALSELARRGHEEHEIAGEMFETLRASIDRGLAITQEILTYAQVGHMAPGDEAVAINPVVTGILEEMAETLKKRGVQVSADVPTQLHLPMKEEHAYAILRNLIANACDAVGMKGEGAKTIRITSQQSAQGVRLFVEDTGIGMSAATQVKVFQPFFTTKGANGTGLGLGLSRKLAQLYGGNLAFTTQENQGTMFELSVPTGGANHD